MLGFDDEERLFPDLNINANPAMMTHQGLGLGDATPQVQPASSPEYAAPTMPAAPTSATEPFQPTGGQRFAAFMAGIGGDPSLLSRLEQKHNAGQKMKMEEASARMDIVKKVGDLAKQIPEGPQRENFLEKASLQYESTFPGIGETIKAVKRPDIFTTLPTALRSDRMLQLHQQAGTLEDFVKSPDGIKYVNNQISRVYSEEFGEKIGPVVDWVKKNRADVYRRVMADEALTTKEIRELHGAVPENIKMSPELFSHALAPENQERLFGQLGVKVITDKTAGEMTEEEFTAKGDSDFQKLIGERSVVERKLDSETDPKKRSRLERDLKDINDRIARDKTKDPTTRNVNTWNVVKDNFEKEFKPVVDLRGKVKVARSALALGTPEADIALQKTMADIFDSGSRAESEVQAWKNSGDVVSRLWQTAYRFGTGEITPERREAIGALLDQIDKDAITPATNDTLKYYEDVAIQNGLDPYLITGRQRMKGASAQPGAGATSPAQAQTGAVAAPKSKADYDKLPPGTTYVHPKTGKKMVKK